MRPLVTLCLISLLLTSSLSQNVLRNVFQPNQFVKKDEVLDVTINPGESWYTFENINYEINAKVHEFVGTSGQSTNNIENFQNNHTGFIQSKDCRVEPSEITMSKISVTNITSDQVRSYHFYNDRVFILADDAISYYALSTDQPTSHPELVMIGQLPNVSTTFNLDPIESKFVSIGNDTYVLDTELLYLIDIKQEGPTTSLHLTKLPGYIPLSQFAELIAVDGKDQKAFVVLSNEAVTEYICPVPTTCNNRSIMNSTHESKHNFVDVAYVKHNIYLLEETQGLYVQRRNFQEYTLEKFPLKFEGKFVKMEVIGSTIEVFGDYFGKRYVVELFIHKNGEDLEDIVINRFYNHITGLRDVDFFDNKAIFIGDQEIMVIGHSINQRLLTSLSKRQNREIYLSYGMLEFDVIESFSNPRKAYIVGISTKNLLVILLNQTAPSLVCDINEDESVYRLLVEFNTTNCAAFDWKDWRYAVSGGESYCRVLESVNYMVSTPVSTKTSMGLKIAALVICIAGILILIGMACKFRKIKFRLFQRLVDEIQKRRVSSQGTAQSI